jgi:hypothetical protein
MSLYLYFGWEGGGVVKEEKSEREESDLIRAHFLCR